MVPGVSPIVIVEEKKLNLVSSGIGFSLAGEFFLFIFSFTLGVLTARFLGSEGKGEFGIVYSVANLITQIFSLRFINSFTYFLAKNKEQIGIFIFFSLLIGSVLLPVGTFLFTFPLISKTLLANIQIDLWVILLISCSTYLWSLINAIFSGLLLFNARALFMGGTYFLKCLIVLVGLVMLRLDVGGLIIFMGSLETFLYLLIVLWFLASSRNFKVDWTIFRSMLNYSLKSYPGMISDLVAHRLDVFIINFFAGTAEVGIYTVGLSMANMLLIIPTSAKAVLMPFIARSNDNEVTPALSKLMIIVMSILGIILLPCAWFLIGPIYGEEFVFARTLMLILLPGTLFLGVFSIFSSDIEGRGLPGKLSIIYIVCGMISMVLYVLLVPILRSTGAAIVGTISNILAMALAAIFLSRLLKIKLKKLLIPEKQDLKNLFRFSTQLSRQIYKLLPHF